MDLKSLVFYAFAALLLVSATMVITARHPVRAVLSLVLTFFCAAVLWLLAQAEFLAIALVLVYVGAVMVLFLFVVMMLDVENAAIKQGFIRYLPVGLGVAGVVAYLIWRLIAEGGFAAEGVAAVTDKSNIEVLGAVLYTDYFYAFELAALILMVALIAAVALTFRGTRMRKIQDVGRQVAVSKDDRLRVVKMEAVKRAPAPSADADTQEKNA